MWHMPINTCIYLYVYIYICFSQCVLSRLRSSLNHKSGHILSQSILKVLENPMNFDNENTVVILTGIVVSPGEVYSLDIEKNPPSRTDRWESGGEFVTPKSLSPQEILGGFFNTCSIGTTGCLGIIYSHLGSHSQKYISSRSTAPKKRWFSLAAAETTLASAEPPSSLDCLVVQE